MSSIIQGTSSTVVSGVESGIIEADFFPTDITGMTFFGDAILQNQADSTAVDTWTDFSGNGFDFPAEFGSFTYNTSGFFGKPGIIMDTTTSTFGNLSDSFYGTSATLIVFCSVGPSPAISPDMIAGFVSSQGFLFHGSSILIRYARSEASGVQNAPGTYDFTGLTMICIRMISDSSSLFRVNDQVDLSFDPDNAWNNNDAVRFGCRDGVIETTIQEFYSGMSYNQSISDSELSQLYNWGFSRYRA